MRRSAILGLTLLAGLCTGSLARAEDPALRAQTWKEYVPDLDGVHTQVAEGDQSWPRRHSAPL